MSQQLTVVHNLPDNPSQDSDYINNILLKADWCKIAHGNAIQQRDEFKKQTITLEQQLALTKLRLVT